MSAKKKQVQASISSFFTSKEPKPKAVVLGSSKKDEGDDGDVKVVGTSSPLEKFTHDSPQATKTTKDPSSTSAPMEIDGGEAKTKGPIKATPTPKDEDDDFAPDVRRQRSAASASKEKVRRMLVSADSGSDFEPNEEELKDEDSPKKKKAGAAAPAPKRKTSAILDSDEESEAKAVANKATKMDEDDESPSKPSPSSAKATAFLGSFARSTQSTPKAQAAPAKPAPASAAKAKAPAAKEPARKKGKGKADADADEDGEAPEAGEAGDDRDEGGAGGAGDEGGEGEDGGAGGAWHPMGPERLSGNLDPARMKERRPLPLAPGSGAKYTPLEQQYVLVQRKYPDAVLLVEVGYKFQFFGEDAEIASHLLHIFCSQGKNAFKAASIPIQRLFVHVRRLVDAGYKVGVVRQTETAALKKSGSNKSGPFTRELAAMYTKATLVGEDVCTIDDLEDVGDFGQTNYIMAIAEEEDPATPGDVQVAMVALHCATGDIVYDTFRDTAGRSELETRISHIAPSEFLLPEDLSPRTDKVLGHMHTVRQERVPPAYFEPKAAYDQVSKFIMGHASNKAKASDASMAVIQEVLNLPSAVIACFGALLKHLQNFKLEDVFHLTSNIRQFSTQGREMILNSTTLRALEIFNNQTTGSINGSLVWVMDHTMTAFGKRALRNWVSRPLLDPAAISARLDAVTELKDHEDDGFFKKITELLKGLPDLERGITSIYYRKCSPAEFLAVVTAFQKTYQLFTSHAPFAKESLTSEVLLAACEDIPRDLDGVDVFVKTINAEAASKKDMANLFLDMEMFPKLAECKKRIRDIEAKLKAFRKDIQATLKLNTFDYKKVSNEEYLVEVSNSDIKRVPEDWIKINATKAASRFRPPEVVEMLHERECEQEQLELDASEAWALFLGQFGENYDGYRRVVKHLAQLDCLFSLVTVAKQEGYVRPEIDPSRSVLDIKGGRHPIVSALLRDQQFVANDTHLGSDAERCMIITGPNMGGKSSYIRQVALISIMAQVGSYVPADAATVGVVDAVYTRMGAFDDMTKGDSTFMVELKEASGILAKATSRSLVIMDELGRGTSTHDGVAIAYATLRYLVEHLRCFCLFVTHYPSLSELVKVHPNNVGVYHMSFMENKEEDAARAASSGGAGDDGGDEESVSILFLYQLVRGQASRSYGLNVARLAGVPEVVVRRANEKSKELEAAINKKNRLSGDALVSFKALLRAVESGDEAASFAALQAMQ